jgi:glycosyltransferase involved in cell wall biosynthesis
VSKLGKITFFSALPPFRGGIAQFSEQFRQALAKKRNVDSYTFQNQYPNFLFPGQSQFEDQKPNFKHPRIVSTFRPWTYFTSLRILRKSKGDLFITSYWMSFFGPMMGFWSRFLSKKTVKIALIHNLIPHEKRFFDGVFNRYFLGGYDGFVLLSDAVRSEVLNMKPNAQTLVLKHPSYQQFGSKMDKMRAREILNLDPRKKTLLFFGLIRDYKGLDLLLKAHSKLDDSFQLLIAGEVYGDRNGYDKLILQSKNKHISFVDQFIPTEEVNIYFSAADLCILPYKTATQSGIKAMCDVFHLPVLVSRAGGLHEEISENETGFVMRSASDGTFAEQIVEIFSDSRLENVAQNVQNQLRNKENEWDEFADSVLKFADMIQQSKKSH